MRCPAEDEFSRRYGLTVSEAIDHLYPLALHILNRNPFDAQDLVNDFLEKLIRRPAPLEPVRNGRSYLRVGLVNHFFDKHCSNEEWYELRWELPDIASTRTSPEQAVEADALWADVKAIVGENDTRSLFYYFAVGSTYAEIAKILNIPESTIGWRIRQAIRKLQEFLGGGTE